MFWVKKHGKVLAACDEDILGKTLAQGNRHLKVNESFYKDLLVGENDLSSLLLESGNINLVGKEVIKIARRLRVVHAVNEIAGVPYAIVFRI